MTDYFSLKKLEENQELMLKVSDLQKQIRDSQERIKDLVEKMICVDEEEVKEYFGLGDEDD